MNGDWVEGSKYPHIFSSHNPVTVSIIKPDNNQPANPNPSSTHSPSKGYVAHEEANTAGLL